MGAMGGAAPIWQPPLPAMSEWSAHYTAPNADQTTLRAAQLADLVLIPCRAATFGFEAITGDADARRAGEEAQLCDPQAPERNRARGRRRGRAGGAARCSATKRIGTNLGLSLASRDELVAAGAPLPAPQRRSGQPSRERRIHLKTRFALTPFARATPQPTPRASEPPRQSADAPPRSKTAASSARRPQRRAQPSLIPLPLSSGVHQIAGGHLTDANGIP